MYKDLIGGDTVSTLKFPNNKFLDRSIFVNRCKTKPVEKSQGVSSASYLTGNHSVLLVHDKD
uniref:Uncharacterized protein n=1 Tax=Arundo donax TaxID=35708 RepID=A0A0A9DHL8_ARUDO